MTLVATAWLRHPLCSVVVNYGALPAWYRPNPRQLQVHYATTATAALLAQLHEDLGLALVLELSSLQQGIGRSS